MHAMDEIVEFCRLIVESKTRLFFNARLEGIESIDIHDSTIRYQIPM